MAFNEEQMVLSRFQAVKFTNPFVLKGGKRKQKPKKTHSKLMVVEGSENEDCPNVNLMFSYAAWSEGMCRCLRKPCFFTGENRVSWHLSSWGSDTIIFVMFELRLPWRRMEEGKGLIWCIHALERVITSRTGQHWGIKEREKGNIYLEVFSVVSK